MRYYYPNRKRKKTEGEDEENVLFLFRVSFFFIQETLFVFFRRLLSCSTGYNDRVFGYVYII
jgi:hypothetical protein